MTCSWNRSKNISLISVSKPTEIIRATCKRDRQLLTLQQKSSAASRQELDGQHGRDGLSDKRLTTAPQHEGNTSAQELSSELKELCNLQLQLASVCVADADSGARGGLVATAYARCPRSFESGTLELIQMAHCGPAAAGTIGRAVLEASQTGADRIVLGAMSPASTETSLISQEWIALPDTCSIVMPLSWGPFLVGLLLLERPQPAQLPRSAQRPSADRAPLADGLCKPFSAREREILLKVARTIAAACVMDHKATLLRAQAACGQERMSGLVRDAQGPLAALCTLGDMLAPRLPDGEPEQDMAQAMVVQGQRLKDVVRQLQIALHQPPGPEAAIAGPAPSSDRARGGALPLHSHAGPTQLLAPPSGVEGPRPRRGGASAGRTGSCNAASVLLDLVSGAVGVCSATGVSIELGEGLKELDGRQTSATEDAVRRPIRPLRVAVPAETVRTAISQVLDSALQRTPRGGRVTVSASLGPEGRGCIWVCDRGERIPEGVVRSLHQGAALPPGRQDGLSVLRRLRSRQPAGLGLVGMKIAADLLSAAGGRLTVDAAAEGGTVACISLPLEAEDRRGEAS